MKYLIIGNSAAGVNAADAIRKNDKTGSITILSNESFPAYGRPLISYYLQGKVKEETMPYRGEDFYKSRKIDVILNSNVSSVDVVKKEAASDDGKKYSYDKLLIATGSSPFIPPTQNLNGQENVFTFLTYGEVKRLKEAVTKKSNVVIVGAGLIGLKAAEGLFGQVAKITVIDLADRVMASVLDKTAGAFIQSHIESNDIDFKLGVSVKEAVGEKRVSKVILSDGSELLCDILIMAVGVRPNISLAKDAGLKVGRAIITDEYMQTSDKDIYAAGDCVESYDYISGQYKILALWPNATNQGETAGRNMSAGNRQKAPNAFAMNAISFFGLQLISAGLIGEADQNSVFDVEANKLRRLNIQDDKLIGFVLINDVQRAGIYTALINEKTPLSSLEYDIKSKDIGLSIYPKDARTCKIWGEK